MKCHFQVELKQADPKASTNFRFSATAACGARGAFCNSKHWITHITQVQLVYSWKAWCHQHPPFSE